MGRESKEHDPFAVLRIKEFNYFLTTRFFLTFGIQMQSVIIGWQVYKHTNDVLILGLIGLAEAIPFILVSLISGHIADTFNRKSILVFFIGLYVILTGGLVFLSLDSVSILKDYGVTPLFLIIGCVGVIRGFLSAAIPAFMAQLIPRSLFSNAATWNSTFWQIASIIGPSIAGLIIAINFYTAYIVDLIFILISFTSLFFIGSKPKPIKERKETVFESLTAGIKFVFKNQIILGALSLDLFAVLLGGAVALLPAFADQVLHAGTIELGFLRAAPALGAVLMALIIAYRPPQKNAGRNLFFAVAGFGIATIGFGLSTNFYLAFFFLFLTGAFDNISVVIRHTVLQLSTPDNMRGRVSAVNGIFIGSSNEIGAFESGATAKLFGLRPSILLGGILTILVVIVTARLTPKLRKLNLKELSED